jgi:hypothetical protein
LFKIRFFNVFGEYRKLDKAISNNLDRWQRLNYVDLALWLDFLSQFGLNNWVELGLRSIRGSPTQPEKGVQINF